MHAIVARNLGKKYEFYSRPIDRLRSLFLPRAKNADWHAWAL